MGEVKTILYFLVEFCICFSEARKQPVSVAGPGQEPDVPGRHQSVPEVPILPN